MSNDDYEVGYGKPPVQHRFQKGQCGNRRGRGKGNKNSSTILAERLAETIRIKQGNATRKISRLEAIHLRLIEKAMQGDMRAVQLLLDRNSRIEVEQQQSGAGALTEDDEEILERFIKQRGMGREGDNDN